MGIIGKAKKVKPAAKKAAEKENHELKGADAQAITDYLKAKAEEAEALQRKKEAEAILKAKGQEIFLAEYAKTGKKPETFILSNKDEGLLYILQDKYKTIDEDRHTYLAETYGEDIVSDETEIVLNEEVLLTHQEEIEKALEKSGLPREILDNMFLAKPKYTVAKGAIENLTKFAAKAKVGIETIVAEILPVEQLKARGKND